MLRCNLSAFVSDYTDGVTDNHYGHSFLIHPLVLNAINLNKTSLLHTFFKKPDNLPTRFPEEPQFL